MTFKIEFVLAHAILSSTNILSDFILIKVFGRFNTLLEPQKWNYLRLDMDNCMIYAN